MVFEISIDEELERQAHLTTDEILPRMAEENESMLVRGGRWKMVLASGALVIVFLGWFWISIVEPRLNWLGPTFWKTSSAGRTPSGSLPGGVSSYFHADENLVKFVQSRLNQMGFHAGRVDGVVGPRTMEAIERFQMNQGLPVTGVIDRKTKEVLDRTQLPKAKMKPYMVARARAEKLEGGSRYIVDLSMDPALKREAVEKYVRQVTIRYARSNPGEKRFHIRAYLGIASLSAGAYAIADWDRKGKDIRSLEGFQIRFQEWTRKDVVGTLPPPKR